MTNRKQPRDTVIELSGALEAQAAATEEIDAVMPAFGNTATVTESTPDALDPAIAPGDRRATLVLVAGPAPGQVYSLKPETVIGRDALADIQLDDSAVSRRHARIVVLDGRYVVEDLGSANGTFVDGARASRRELYNGTRIQLGPRVVLRFGLLDDAEEKMHRQLFESSTRDALTGAYNKKYITERLDAEVAYARRHKSSLELVVFDLDKFKSINDHYGHLIGDAVLRGVADRVHAVIRSEDVFGRFGGEEFVVISRASDSSRLAERIRVGIEQLVIPTDRGAVRVTVSLGVARLEELAGPASVRALIDMADLRLLTAKRLGRNQVCWRD